VCTMVYQIRKMWKRLHSRESTYGKNFFFLKTTKYHKIWKHDWQKKNCQRHNGTRQICAVNNISQSCDKLLKVPKCCCQTVNWNISHMKNTFRRINLKASIVVSYWHWKGKAKRGVHCPAQSQHIIQSCCLRCTSWVIIFLLERR